MKSVMSQWLGRPKCVLPLSFMKRLCMKGGRDVVNCMTPFLQGEGYPVFFYSESNFYKADLANRGNERVAVELILQCLLCSVLRQSNIHVCEK